MPSYFSRGNIILRYHR